jgi:glycosyltransferase involved in cell wall biosynthesis
MPEKILIVTEYFYPEEFKINEVAEAWKQKGYDVDILTQNPTYPSGKVFDDYPNKWYSEEQYKGMSVYRVKAVTGYKESVFKKILKYFTFMIFGSYVGLRIGKRYDYVFGFDIASLTGMVPAILIQKFYGKKVTLWVQDIWPDSVYAYGFKKTKPLQYVLDIFVRFVYRHTSHFAVSGEGFRQKILPYIDRNQPIEYFPNWADSLNEALPPFAFSDDAKVHFTFAGNVGKVQNLDRVIEAFGLLKPDMRERAQLNIIGDGSDRARLQAIVHSQGLDNVVFWGQKPREEMYRYYAASDFLLVSLIDKPIFSLTVPAKVQTYIAAKKPILAIIAGDAARIVCENHLGYCADPGNPEAIRKVFEQAIETDSTELEAFSRNCQRLTDTVFDKNNIITSLLHFVMR